MRVRLRFSKLGKIRWTSHRDVARAWERALRRVELPLVYTAGFTPRPRVSFGLALSTGHESLGEYLDVDLDGDRMAGHDVAGLPALLTPALPVGIDVATAAEIAPGTASLQEAVTSCTWRIEASGTDPGELSRRVASALAANSLVVTRTRKGQQVTDDLRPAILSLEVVGPTAGGCELEAELATLTRGVRPAELLAALDPTLEEGRVCRMHQWIVHPDGARGEPLPLPGRLDATSEPHAEARAS